MPELYELPARDPARTTATLYAMAALTRDDALQASVRQTAAFLVGNLGRDQSAYAQAIAGWVALHTRYLDDPLEHEALVRPVDLLALIAHQGIGQVDCDDVAMLAAALGLSVGLRARFVAVAFGSAPDFSHVWAELGATDGALWVAVDPTRPMFFPAVEQSPLVLEL